MNKTLLAFDFDGVLVDSLMINLKCAQVAAALLDHPVVPKESHIRALKVMTFEELAEVIGISQEKIADFVKGIHSELKNSSLALFSGIDELIRKLGEQFNLAIVTGNSEGIVSSFLHKNDLHRYFNSILGAETEGDKTAKLHMLAAEFDIPEKNIVMVGDSASDIAAAHEAGTQSVAVTWGFQVDELINAKPGLVVDTREELLEELVKISDL